MSTDPNQERFEKLAGELWDMYAEDNSPEDRAAWMGREAFFDACAELLDRQKEVWLEV